MTKAKTQPTRSKRTKPNLVPFMVQLPVDALERLKEKAREALTTPEKYARLILYFASR